VSEERLIILRKIESGDISIEDGQRLIDALDGRINPVEELDGNAQEEESSPEPQAVEHVDVIETGHEKTAPPDFGRWRTWGWVAFGVFVFLTALSAMWMVLGWQTRPWGWGFWLSWIPFLVGVVGMIATYQARWLHVRIRQAPGSKPEKISISLPLPLGLASLAMNTFSRWMPVQVREQHIGEMIKDLDRNIHKDEPLHIQVEDDDGERVEVFIG
jgi:hypothetical protein